ncbi:MAG: hypothetical protein R3B70_03325 [Polyangiaceae bacterium]
MNEETIIEQARRELAAAEKNTAAERAALETAESAIREGESVYAASDSQANAKRLLAARDARDLAAAKVRAAEGAEQTARRALAVAESAAAKAKNDAQRAADFERYQGLCAGIGREAFLSAIAADVQAIIAHDNAVRARVANIEGQCAAQATARAEAAALAEKHGFEAPPEPIAARDATTTARAMVRADRLVAGVSPEGGGGEWLTVPESWEGLRRWIGQAFGVGHYEAVEQRMPAETQVRTIIAEGWRRGRATIAGTISAGVGAVALAEVRALADLRSRAGRAAVLVSRGEVTPGMFTNPADFAELAELAAMETEAEAASEAAWAESERKRLEDEARAWKREGGGGIIHSTGDRYMVRDRFKRDFVAAWFAERDKRGGGALEAAA